MRQTGNTQESLLPRKLKEHGEREGARTQKEPWFCEPNKSCDLRQSCPVTVAQDQARREQESHQLDLSLFPDL